MSESAKVMVDASVGNNMLYLPLDKIMGQAAKEAASSDSPDSAGSGGSSSSSKAAGAAQSATSTNSSRGSPARRGVPSGLDSLMTNPYSN
ncbi:Protein HflK OS=Castellaniella defragrans OX=75697 GN=HNR28_001917 PE=3 SV=1 [Castellaniella defragrans]